MRRQSVVVGASFTGLFWADMACVAAAAVLTAFFYVLGFHLF